MRGRRLGWLLVAAFGWASIPVLAAPVVPGPEIPDDALALVQSEVDYLPVAQRKISVEVREAVPATFLDAVRDATDLTIEVQGTLPTRPLLTASFKRTKTKKILAWFATQVPVTYKAQPPDKLIVIVDDETAR
jgi:hypothetical protein